MKWWWKFYAERLKQYLAWVQLIMVGMVWWRTDGTWWILLLLPLAALVVVLDMRKVYPSEAAEMLRKNPEWMENRQDVKRIIQILEGMQPK